MENSRRCDICNVNIKSFAKHLGSKKQLKNIRQDHIFKLEWFFKQEETPIKKKKTRKILNHKILTQIARDKIKVDDKEKNEKNCLKND